MNEQILYIHDHHMPACGSDLIVPIDGWESILIGQVPSIKYPEWMNKLFRIAMNEDCNYIIFSSGADQDADREDIPSYQFYWYFDGNDFVLGDPVSGTQVRLISSYFADHDWDERLFTPYSTALGIAKILKGETTYAKLVFMDEPVHAHPPYDDVISHWKDEEMRIEPLQVQNIIHTHDDLHSIIVGGSSLDEPQYESLKMTAENMGFIRMIASAYKGGK